jgi:3-phenylpropionate/trans-cinnamate dioxygenase ferredoxin reductase component
VSGAGVVIAGGGLVAARTATALRGRGFAQPIRILAGEQAWPYDRPPLSKELLAEETAAHEIALLDADDAERLEIEVTLGRPVVSASFPERRLLLDGGEHVRFEQLVIATGARPRRIAQLDRLPCALTLRDAHEAHALRTRLQRGTRLVVIGAGFIGLEVASAALARGCEVTVVEAGSVPMGAVLGAELGRILAEWHAAHGVRLLCGRTVLGASASGAGALIELSDGVQLAADVVLVAVGVQPNVEWLEGSELADPHGVPCDFNGRTALPGVFAAGDVARPLRDGRAASVGHWTPANDMARRVAELLTGGEADAREIDDYFWSDQLGARLQLAGSIAPDAEIVVQAGALEDWSFLASCRSQGRPSAVFAMNRPRDFIKARLEIERTPA